MGFQGYISDGVTVKMPTKNPKGKELIDEQKDANRSISSFRVLVEHAIGMQKDVATVKDRFRCHKFGFVDLVMELVCGLHIFRISLNINSV